MTTPSIRISNSDDLPTPKNRKPNLSLTSVHTFSTSSDNSEPETPTLKKAKFRSLKFIDKAERLTKENLEKFDDGQKKVSFRNSEDQDSNGISFDQGEV